MPGFVASRPIAASGGSSLLIAAGTTYAQKFTCPGSGTQELLEIGAWCGTNINGQQRDFTMGVFTDDAINTCPESLVANSSGAALTSVLTKAAVYYAYGSRPQVTGGVDYWLALIEEDNSLSVSYSTTGGTTVQKTGLTYPNWPTGTTWETHTNRTYNIDFYAVYQSAATSVSATATCVFDIRGLVQAAATALFDVRNILRSTSLLSFDILSGITAIQSALTVVYDIQHLPVSSTMTANYDVLVKLQSDVKALYDAFEKVQSTTTGLYDSAGNVQSDLELLFDLALDVAKGLGRLGHSLGLH